ncbi:MAG: hypothetical protein N3D11_12505 [Candidatus Sumerlaeia bacterium]|nr:hypothetical protein [Candidatus Sumerlaeia bacterium]
MDTTPARVSTTPDSPRTIGTLPPLILAAVVGAVLGFLWPRLDSIPLSSDQIGIATLLLKYSQPELFPTETGLRPIDIYPNTYLGILRLVTLLAGDVRRAFFLLGAVSLIAFAFGVYRLMLETVARPWIALVAAVAALWFRAAFEGQQWQIADFGACLPRSIPLAMVPWLLLACSRWQGRWQLVGVFVALGIVANYHPLSALYLAVIFGLTLLAQPARRLRHAMILAVSVPAFSLAAAPYFLQVNHAIRRAAAQRKAEGFSATPEQIEAVRRQIPHSAFPPPFATVRWVGFHILLPGAAGAAGLFLRRRRLGDGGRIVASFLAAVLVYSVGGAAVEAVLRKTIGFQKSYLFLRSFHLVYLPLFIFCAWLIEDLWTGGGRATRRLAAVALAATLLVPASWPEYAVRYVKYRGAVPQRPSLEFDPDFTAMCDWIRHNTAVADIVVVPPAWNLFALLAQRSIAGSAKEISFVLYEPEVGVIAYEKYRAVSEAYENPAPDALPAVARRYGARYVVTDSREIAAPLVYERGRYRVYEVR